MIFHCYVSSPEGKLFEATNRQLQILSGHSIQMYSRTMKIMCLMFHDYLFIVIANVIAN